MTDQPRKPDGTFDNIPNQPNRDWQREGTTIMSKDQPQGTQTPQARRGKDDHKRSVQIVGGAGKQGKQDGPQPGVEVVKR